MAFSKAARPLLWFWSFGSFKYIIPLRFQLSAVVVVTQPSVHRLHRAAVAIDRNRLD